MFLPNSGLELEHQTVSGSMVVRSHFFKRAHHKILCSCLEKKKKDEVGVYITWKCIHDLLMNARRRVLNIKHRMSHFVKSYVLIFKRKTNSGRMYIILEMRLPLKDEI